MTTLLKRKATLTRVTVEPFLSLDGQGVPSYGLSESTAKPRARVVRTESFVTMSDGSRVDTVLTLYIDGAQQYLPVRKDRLTIDDVKYIVMERKSIENIKQCLDHIRLKCREE